MTTPVQTSATAQRVKIGAGFWVSYIFLIFYIAVSADAVTNVDLLLENRVKLTFLDRDLPLVGFFFSRRSFSSPCIYSPCRDS